MIRYRDPNYTEERTEEAEKNPNVPPSVRVFDVEWQEELVTNLDQRKCIDTRILAHNTHRILAIPAPHGVIRVVKVAACSFHKVARPGRTRLARWRIKHGKFVGLTCYFKSTAGSNCQTSHKIRGCPDTYWSSVDNIAASIRVKGSSWYSQDLQNLMRVG
jgi:hypothetical protein